MSFKLETTQAMLHDIQQNFHFFILNLLKKELQVV